MIIIEFAGLPGSGKTTIAERLTLDGVLVTRPKVHHRDARAMRRHPLRTAREVVPWAPELLRWSDRTALITILRRRRDQDALTDDALTDDALTEGGGTVTVLGEGITHHVWRALFLSPDLVREPWSRLLRAPYPVIALEADRQTLRARILGKGEVGDVNRLLARASPDGPEWQRATDLYAEVLAEASRYRPVFRIDSSTEVESSIMRVRDRLRELPELSGRAHRSNGRAPVRPHNPPSPEA